MKNIVYDHQAIEEKWQQYWSDVELFQNQPVADPKDKEYLLFAFAYPSGSGLHVGHVESKTALDMLARYYRMNGKDVFFPVGWDAFGLPAENYAIKTGTPPAVTTKQAIDTFRRQIKRLGVSYDWANETATNHPEYYRWTQWLFSELYKKNLAYRGKGSVNWCPQDQTVLANEQVVDGHCERCGAEVVQKELEQWYFRITEYRDELLSGLEQVDWPEATKQHQRNWIGKSEGALITFHTKQEASLEVYTTAHDTIFGCTFMVIAPENPWLLSQKKHISNWSEVESYVTQAAKKTELQRQMNKDKTGVKVEGVTFINPVNQREVPLYVADYVLAGYGTGAIMAVPGHDERDFQFAQQFGLEVIPTFKPRQDKSESGQKEEIILYADIKANPTEFLLVNSGQYDGLNAKEGRAKMLADFASAGFGQKKEQYKLRDWLISRQRYWGAPIPVVYDPEGKPHLVKEEHLPWLLPTDVDFKPTGESPLRSSKEFIERTEKLYGKGWRPEFDTMDTFVDSSWYFLRYCDSRNTKQFADPAKLKAWLPVDLYLIGPEHIVLHLLYARFFTKFLRDEGYLDIDEPFAKMRHQGMILGPDGKKMSKSKGNVINPDEIIEKFGADTLRIYEMFMGPLEADKPWDDRAVAGVARFLRRIHRLVLQPTSEKTEGSLVQKLHQTLKKVDEDIPALKFNTAIAMMMELINLWEKLAQDNNSGVISQEDLLIFIKMLAPFAPFLADELYAKIQGLSASDEYQGVHVQTWPKFDEQLAQDRQITIAVQVNGKLRGELVIEADKAIDESAVINLSKTVPGVEKWLADKKIVKEIYISGRLVNLVTV